MMKIEVFPLGPFSTNCYFISNHQGSVIIDPGQNALSAIRSKFHITPGQVSAIWLTHSHWDHTVGLKECQEFFDVPIYVHPLDRKNIEYPGSDGIPCMVMPPPVHTDIHPLEEGMILKAGEVKFRVIHTPGHSPGGVCFYSEEHQVLFSGDTLFKGMIGSLTLPTGEPSKMWPSLEKLAILPKETKIFPGHGPSTVLKDEEWIHQAEQIFGENI